MERSNSVRSACFAKRLVAGVESGESAASEDTIKLQPEEAVQRFEHYELVTGEDGKAVELVAVRWASLTRHLTSIFTVP